MPAESTSNVMPCSADAAASTISPIGERQMFPVHTTSTFMIRFSPMPTAPVKPFPSPFTGNAGKDDVVSLPYGLASTGNNGVTGRRTPARSWSERDER